MQKIWLITAGRRDCSTDHGPNSKVRERMGHASASCDEKFPSVDEKRKERKKEREKDEDSNWIRNRHGRFASVPLTWPWNAAFVDCFHMIPSITCSHVISVVVAMPVNVSQINFSCFRPENEILFSLLDETAIC